MPKKRNSFRPPRRPGQRGERADGRGGVGGVTLRRLAVPQPASPTTLRAAGGGNDGEPERWELTCRDGWEWQRAPDAGGVPRVWVRRAILNPDQAYVVGQWIEQIRDPASWWQVSRALQTPESAPTVAQQIAVNPWLRDVLPAILEASTDGAPPPPPAAS